MAFPNVRVMWEKGLLFEHWPGWAAQSPRPLRICSLGTVHRTDLCPPHRNHCDTLFWCPESFVCTGGTSCPENKNKKQRKWRKSHQTHKYLCQKFPEFLTFSLSQILSLLRNAMLSRSSLVISSTDFTTYALFLENWPMIFLRLTLTWSPSTCPAAAGNETQHVRQNS